jgi:hypothetical protein
VGLSKKRPARPERGRLLTTPSPIYLFELLSGASTCTFPATCLDTDDEGKKALFCPLRSRSQRSRSGSWDLLEHYRQTLL